MAAGGPDGSVVFTLEEMILIIEDLMRIADDLFGGDDEVNASWSTRSRIVSSIARSEATRTRRLYRRCHVHNRTRALHIARTNRPSTHAYRALRAPLNRRSGTGYAG